MEEIIKILEGIKPGVDFSKQQKLIADHVLESMAVVRLVGELNDEFDIEITPVDVVPENFESVEAIYNLVKRLEDE